MEYCYVGTYTEKGSSGIYGLAVEQGKFTGKPELLAEQVSPSYLYLNREGTILYAASEPTDGSRGMIVAYDVDPRTKALTPRNRVKAPGGGICHLAMDPSERFLFAVAYEDATVQSYPIDEKGNLTPMFCMRRHIGGGPDKSRQEKAHAHSTCITPDGRYAIVCDLGMDQLVVYDVNPASGKLKLKSEMCVPMPPGSGPRHMVFHPNGKYAYVLTEMGSSIVAFEYSAEVGLRARQEISSLEAGFRGTSCAAAIRITKAGDRIYVSNRGEESIACFSVDEDGKLWKQQSVSTHGKHPRDCSLTPQEDFLLAANQNSDHIVSFKRTEEGLQEVDICHGISMPACVLFWQQRVGERAYEKGK
ncbi:lactonase family protein [Bianquea renquensis]|jgi:hypothetical protein|uniref:Lactonase family protein n=1 Tax=Bianquea renquensis TaxID=2763661 RepID=A0A926HZJ9_9FIRM|nr:lactonase family protein [Bianquea renquensis]MBC8542209.1 lactonase family protein [Bianquea renquensis]